MVLITYDIDTTDAAGRKRLKRIAKACVNYGQRVQASVFECDVDAATLVTLKAALLEIADHFGTKPSYDPEGFLAL